MGNNGSHYRMPSYHATLTLNYDDQEFREHCVENSVVPDDDMLRSWLMQRAVDDELEKVVKLYRCALDGNCVPETNCCQPL